MKEITIRNARGFGRTKWKVKGISVNYADPSNLRATIIVVGAKDQTEFAAGNFDDDTLDQTVRITLTDNINEAWAEAIVVAEGGILEGAT